MALSTHDDYIGISHSTLYNGGTQVHRDEVELIHCEHKVLG